MLCGTEVSFSNNPDNVIRVGGLETGVVVFERCGGLGLMDDLMNRCYCVALWEVEDAEYLKPHQKLKVRMSQTQSEPYFNKLIYCKLQYKFNLPCNIASAEITLCNIASAEILFHLVLFWLQQVGFTSGRILPLHTSLMECCKT